MLVLGIESRSSAEWPVHVTVELSLQHSFVFFFKLVKDIIYSKRMLIFVIDRKR